MSADQNPSSSGADTGVAAGARLIAFLGGLLVVGLGLLVTASVLLRWLAGAGIDGDFELVQMGLAVAAFSFLPLCQAHRGNVIVDTFTSALPRRVQAGLDVLWDIVFAAFSGFIAWRLAVGATEAWSSATTSMVLGLPIHYAIGLCAGMAAFLALVCVVTAYHRARNSR
jgi:TRAP-type C4-dicarboxylate transport system permease small subunit